MEYRQDLLPVSIESAPPPEDHVVDMANLIDKLLRDAGGSAGRHTIRLSR
jgi:two-component system phosphate regulon sensor histidine kinase PhoR